MPKPTLELVVAHYHEDLRWLRRVPAVFQKTIYSKAEPPPLQPHLPLPNVGREAHTYLHHIVSRYDSLADYTVFCQGKPFDHAYDFHASLRALAADNLPKKPFTWLGHIIDTDTPNGVPCSGNGPKTKRVLGWILPVFIVNFSVGRAGEYIPLCWERSLW